MLTISRLPGQEFYLDTADGRITIHIVEIRGKRDSQRARIAIDAPRHVDIVRDDATNTTRKPDHETDLPER